MKTKIKPSRILLAFAALGILLSAAGCSLHEHEYEKAVTAPDCTKGGYTVFTCACGDSYKGEETKASGHDCEESVIAPDYTERGYTHFRCKVCGYEYDDLYTEMPSEVVAEGAKKDYLLPFDLFAKERTQNPSFVMIHFTSAVAISKTDPYNMETIRGIFSDNEVSVHYIIHRDGTVTCYVPEDLVAYHAGKGTWANDEAYTNKMNEYAIGIELAAIGSQNDMAQYLSKREYAGLDPDLIGFTDAQYDALKTLVTDICRRNRIPMDREHVIGHMEYSPAKSDPGELFDWDRLLS